MHTARAATAAATSVHLDLFPPLPTVLLSLLHSSLISAHDDDQRGKMPAGTSSPSSLLRRRRHRHQCFRTFPSKEKKSFLLTEKSFLRSASPLSSLSLSLSQSVSRACHEKSETEIGRSHGSRAAAAAEAAAATSRGRKTFTTSLPPCLFLQRPNQPTARPTTTATTNNQRVANTGFLPVDRWVDGASEQKAA